MNKILILACFVNGLLLCTNRLTYFIWIVLALIFQLKTHYFKNQHFLVFFIFFLLGQNTWVVPNHQILETKEKYAIASIDHRRVLIYTDKPYFKGDEVKVIGEMQDIRSNSNFNAFHFETMMKRKKITQMLEAEAVEIKPQLSLKHIVFERIQQFDEKTQHFLKRILYNYENETKSLIYSSGLHYSLMNQMILQSISSPFIGNILGILVMLCLGIAFPSPYALQRILIFNSIRMIFPSISRKERLGVSMLACMFVQPSCVFELGYIVPITLQLVACFNCLKFNSSWLSKLVLVFLNFFFFGEVNFIEIALFSFFRKLHTLGFIFACLIVIFPFLDFLALISVVFDALAQLPKCSCFGKPPFIMSVLFVLCFVLYLSYGKMKMGITCVLMIVLIPLQSMINPFYEVTFLNVGQGDCILIRAPFNQGNILIDIPVSDIWNVSEEVVVPYLKSIGVNRLDVLILTHDDLDHAGGENQLKQLIQVKKTIKTHEDVVLGPLTLHSLNSKHEEENENSLVYALNIHGCSYLFMGDATRRNEKEIIERFPTLQADILKVGHHGSKTSTSSLFLQQLKTRLAVISAGYHNFYGHPHEETLSTLVKYGVKEHITFRDGACKIKSFLNLHFLYTSTGDFDIIIK